VRHDNTRETEGKKISVFGGYPGGGHAICNKSHHRLGSHALLTCASAQGRVYVPHHIILCRDGGNVVFTASLQSIDFRRSSAMLHVACLSPQSFPVTTYMTWHARYPCYALTDHQHDNNNKPCASTVVRLRGQPTSRQSRPVAAGKNNRRFTRSEAVRAC